MSDFHEHTYFDDTQSAVLQMATDDNPQTQEIAYRHLIDLAIRGRIDLTDRNNEAYRSLRVTHKKASPEVRRNMAALIADHAPHHFDLIRFFLREPTEILAPLLTTMHLSTQEWIRLCARLDWEGRQILQKRTDLPPEVKRILDDQGGSHRTLESPRQLKFAANDDDFDDRLAPALMQADWGWESDHCGVITKMDRLRDGLAGEAPKRGPDTVYLSALLGDATAVDYARTRQIPFGNLRISSTHSPLDGDYLINGIPMFDRQDGRFLGYRGTLQEISGDRRPATYFTSEERQDYGLDNVTQIHTANLLPDELDSSGLATLAHELRTPLNAITGYAQMIEGEYVTPLDPSYKNQAGTIIAQVHDILQLLSDMTDTARVESGRYNRTMQEVDLPRIVDRAVTSLAKITKQHAITLNVQSGYGLPLLWGDEIAIEGLITRMIALTIMEVPPGSTVCILLWNNGDDKTQVAIRRPGKQDRRSLDGETRSRAGYTMRLAQKSADVLGAKLELTDSQFLLVLPPWQEANLKALQRSGE